MTCVRSIFHDLRTEIFLMNFTFVCGAVSCLNLSLEHVTELTFGVYIVDLF